MNFDLNGKIALVTGGARGIGRAVAVALAQAGADVAVGDIDLDTAAAAGEPSGQGSVADEIKALGRRAIAVQGDLRHRAGADALVAAALGQFGRIDILVNNAGGFLAPAAGSWPSKMSEEDPDFMLDVNLKSTLFCCQAVLPSMQAQGSGSIVNIASGLGLEPAARAGLGAHYGLSKAAVVHYTRTLAAELGPLGIRVNAVSPGMIATARVVAAAAARKIGTDEDVAKVSLRRRGSAEEIASVVEFFASDASSYVSGQCLSVCGGRILTPS
jgi:NAD(P)-dependent dehydrogenase (short-subunit alcohol dehydrogenase family)